MSASEIRSVGAASTAQLEQLQKHHGGGHGGKEFLKAVEAQTGAAATQAPQQRSQVQEKPKLNTQRNDKGRDDEDPQNEEEQTDQPPQRRSNNHSLDVTV